MQQDIFYTVALSQYRGLSVQNINALLGVYGRAEDIFTENPATLSKIGRAGETLSDAGLRAEAFRKAEAEMRFIEENRIDVLLPGGDKYPRRLSQCPDAPFVLYKNGTTDLNSLKYIAIVGTRRATHYGAELAEKLISEIASERKDVVVISGLAYGIDITAHRAALRAGLGTVGVVAHGLDTIYPGTHSATALDMLRHGGALITEYPTHTRPEARNFIQRNRIVAGMCDATVVIESAVKGGSMITARLALDYNRDVAAFPGRVGDEHSEGCNALIRDNKAQLITSGHDLLAMLNWESRNEKVVQQSLFDTISLGQRQILDVISDGPAHINTIAAKTGMPVQTVSALLTEMSFDNMVTQLPGDQYKKSL